MEELIAKGGGKKSSKSKAQSSNEVPRSKMIENP
jgi:hypothetical protein